jgi:plastocyanin
MRRLMTIGLITAAMILPVAVARAGGGGGCFAETATERTATDVAYLNLCPRPTVLHVTAGQTVTWKNLDDVDHTVTSGFGGWASETLHTGATFSHRFDHIGTYTYYCMLHPNMGGVIDVRGATTPLAKTAPVTHSSNMGIAAVAGLLGLIVGGTGVGLRARKRPNGSGGQQP